MQKEFAEILDRYLEGKASPEEEKLVNDWYESVSKDWNSTFISSEKLAVNKNLKARVMEYVQKTEMIGPKEVRFKISYPLWTAAAAATLLIIVSSILLFNSRTDEEFESASIQAEAIAFKTIENSDKFSKTINLEDGSRITLKSGSQLKIPHQFHPEHREVYLKGEAFFEVARDPSRPFMVYANQVVTKVLGTSFTVKASDKKVTVSVKTGKVSVYKQSENSRDEKQIILTPNQQAVYDKSLDQVSRTLVEEPKIILPSDELIKMRFEDAPIAEIFNAIEKAYGVDILYDEKILSSCSLTTSLLDETLYTRLNIICKAIGATYTVEDTQIVIESSGCH